MHYLFKIFSEDFSNKNLEFCFNAKFIKFESINS